MKRECRLADQIVGDGHPTYVVAEIGINHNGDVDIARQLIDNAMRAGCNAVKFQKRTPELCVPRDQRDFMRDTPWGRMTYLEYRERVEFGYEQYDEINDYCRQKGIDWFASCWDLPSVDFMEQFNPVCYKIASASLSDDKLLRYTCETGRPVILSTGMSSESEIRRAVSCLEMDRLVITHSTSTYPCDPSELNLKMIQTLRAQFPCPIGYSGHEVGLSTTCAAVCLGASLVERHITLDRAMWGSDQAASVEPWGLARLVRDIRVLAVALGDGVKHVYESELPNRRKLRRLEADITCVQGPQLSRSMGLSG